MNLLIITKPYTIKIDGIAKQKLAIETTKIKTVIKNIFKALTDIHIISRVVVRYSMLPVYEQ